jgi:hypothetical protein
MAAVKQQDVKGLCSFILMVGLLVLKCHGSGAEP